MLTALTSNTQYPWLLETQSGSPSSMQDHRKSQVHIWGGSENSMKQTNKQTKKTLGDFKFDKSATPHPLEAQKSSGKRVVKQC